MKKQNFNQRSKYDIQLLKYTIIIEIIIALTYYKNNTIFSMIWYIFIIINYLSLENEYFSIFNHWENQDDNRSIIEILWNKEKLPPQQFFISMLMLSYILILLFFNLLGWIFYKNIFAFIGYSYL